MLSVSVTASKEKQLLKFRRSKKKPHQVYQCISAPNQRTRGVSSRQWQQVIYTDFSSVVRNAKGKEREGKGSSCVNGAFMFCSLFHFIDDCFRCVSVHVQLNRYFIDNKNKVQHICNEMLLCHLTA